MKKNVISRKLLPAQFPLSSYAVIWLLLDRFKVSDIWLGVYWTIVILSVISFIISIGKEKEVNLSELP